MPTVAPLQRGSSSGGSSDDVDHEASPGRETIAQYNEAALLRTRSYGDASVVSVPATAVSGAQSSSTHSSGASAELEEMRKKLGQFMLGGDMSGGQAGTHAALTLSNAITNLSVGCWSTVAELAPLPSANLVKWRQQLKWYTAPLEQIIVKEEGVKRCAPKKSGKRARVWPWPWQPARGADARPG